MYVCVHVCVYPGNGAVGGWFWPLCFLESSNQVPSSGNEKAIQSSLTTFSEGQLVKMGSLEAKKGKLENKSCNLKHTVCLAVR